MIPSKNKIYRGILKEPTSLQRICEGVGINIKPTLYSRIIDNVAPLNYATPCSLCFNLGGHIQTDSVVIASYEADNVVTSNLPRNDYVRILNWINDNIGFSKPKLPHFISEKAVIHPNSTIEDGVIIGDYTTIAAGAIIMRGTTIGDHCEIGQNTVIGSHGFGFERMENGEILRFNHFGGVDIGNHVTLGPLNSVAKGTFKNTIIEDYVKTDAITQIGHNCIIRSSAIVTAQIQLCGGVEIKENAWIAPNVTILNNVVIGKSAFIGLGAVVLKSIPDHSVAYGNPARVKV